MTLIRCALSGVFALAIMTAIQFTPSSAEAGVVEFRNHQLLIDGRPQPQLYGAEIQYFRLRGGQGRNIPRETVLTLWNRVLDRAVEAKMNTVSFYIPWDFHEYADGKWDFEGKVDEDGDGRPDYPSRDVKTFIRMILARGITNIMIRPGPYINAEWGFLGFGAIPMWLHEKYPNSHMRNAKGQRTTLYSYHDPDLLRLSRRWIERVYRDVAEPYIGPGKPIHFIQIDNETNFMWQSIYNHDYGARAVSRYQDFLRRQYGSIDKINSRYRKGYRDWSEIQPPAAPDKNIQEDQDWYRFQDETIYVYLQEVRKMWEDVGVREPTVLFTLAESYNAQKAGLLPHFQYRNEPGKTGMMTVNLYPKMWETPDSPLFNYPFKSDHDVKAAETASDYYLGSEQEWLMGPEIQGGWWKGTNVSHESRQQTYLTTLGHGLKALFIYYFNEGDNWDWDWAKKAIAPYYATLRADARYKDLPEDQLPENFWSDLDDIVANNLFAGWNTWAIWRLGGIYNDTLFFDAPLGPDAQPRAPYQLVKDIGERVMAPHGDFLGRAVAVHDPVCFVKDSASHAPSPVPGVVSTQMNADWAGGLLALLMHSGVNAKIHHWGLNPVAELLDQKKCKLIIYQDNGFSTSELSSTLARAVANGAGLLNFIHDGLTNSILSRPTSQVTTCSRLPSQPIEVNGNRCAYGRGVIYQARTPIYDVFNTDFYFKIVDVPARRQFIDGILLELGITPQVQINGGGDRTVAFARTAPGENRVWITVKTGRTDGFSGHIQWSRANPRKWYLVTDVMAGSALHISGAELARTGFPSYLQGNGSTAYNVVELSN